MGAWPLNSVILRYLRESEVNHSLPILLTLHWLLPDYLRDELEILPRYQQATEFQVSSIVEPELKDFFETKSRRLRYEILFDIKFVMWNPRMKPQLRPTEDQLKEWKEQIQKLKTFVEK